MSASGADPAKRSDELFSPTLDDAPTPTPAGGQRPWRLESQFAVAFFGGGGALVTIAYLNAKRLGMSSSGVATVLALGLAGWLLALVAGVATGRIFPYQIIVVGTWAALRARQRPADRRYHYYGEGEEGYASLRQPGLVAALGFRLLEGLILVSTLRVLLG